MTVEREQWLDHVDDVIRSRHYTWIPRGLGGEPVEEAMSWLITDIMHICQRSDASWKDVLAKGRARFLKEETELVAEGSAPPDS